MSSIEAEEAKIKQAQRRIHDVRVTETRARLGTLLKNGNDKELAEVCRKMAGLLNPPSANRKPKPQISPIPQ